MQNHDEAVAFGVAGALVLEQCVLGAASVTAAIAAAKPRMHPLAQAAVERAEAAVELPTGEFLGQLGPLLMPENSKAHLAGRSCGFPQAFAGAIHAMLRAADYASGVRGNIVAGGDNCCRASFVGACLAASAVMSSTSKIEVIPSSSSPPRLAALGQCCRRRHTAAAHGFAMHVASVGCDTHMCVAACCCQTCIPIDWLGKAVCYSEVTNLATQISAAATYE